MMKFKFGIILWIAALLSSCAPSQSNPEPTADISSQLVRRSDTPNIEGEWGRFRPYFRENSLGTSKNIVAFADILPGQEPHPPHRHADEEYLMVTAGRGNWYLNGETFPAETGDILYAKPWDYHSITAAPDSNLQITIIKWTGKGVNAVDPNPNLPEEITEIK